MFFYNGAVQNIKYIVESIIDAVYYASTRKGGSWTKFFLDKLLLVIFVLLGNLGITIYGAKAIAERRDNSDKKQKKSLENASLIIFL